MNITCPYCYSENVSRETTQSSGGNSFSSMAGAGIGATISKSFPTPLSPLLGGLAGAVIGGLIDSFIQPQDNNSQLAISIVITVNETLTDDLREK